MAGVTCTLMKLDKELKECIEYECDSVGIRQFQRK
jgi:dihydroxyacetone kinase-like protein